MVFFERVWTLLQKLYAFPELIAWGGYVVLFAIIFAETGLFFGFFLPGDSLLVTAGLLSATGVLNIVWLNLVLIVAAVSGDAVGYYFGHTAGQALFRRPDSRLFKREYLLRTQHFYEKYGRKTIVLARFVPIVRTFAPILAGTAGMGYPAFAAYNVLGGILWVMSMTLIGYFLGRTIPGIDKYVHWIIVIVIVLSFVPALIEYFTEKKIDE